MENINLLSYSKAKLDKTILSKYGGKTFSKKWRFRIENGFGGLNFVDSQTKISYHVSLAFYKNGLGIFYRNSSQNNLILLHLDEIVNIELIQKKGIFDPHKWSLYTMLRSLGVPHRKAFVYLMPIEIVEYFPCNLHINTIDHKFTFEVPESRTENLSKAINNTIFVKYFKEDVSKYH
jgi:hypothetical protein